VFRWQRIVAVFVESLEYETNPILLFFIVFANVLQEEAKVESLSSLCGFAIVCH
jgi:hypothetical protein